MSRIGNKKFRKRKISSGSEEESSEDVPTSSLEAIRDIQKLRKKPAGLTATELGYGAMSDQSSEEGGGTSTYRGGDSGSGPRDPLRLQSGGGMIDLKTLKRSDWAHVNVEENLKQTFSRESHLRDEDEEMRRYVEEELARRKGLDVNPSTSGEQKDSEKEWSEDALFALPDDLKDFTSRKNEEMLSNQMLSGIPEVDLGLEAKIKNIEETEAAKLRLLKQAAEKKRSVEEATTARQNMAKELAQGYVQHARYKIDKVTLCSSADKPIDRPLTEPVPVVDEDTPRWVLMEKTPGGSNKKPLKMLAKPTDKELYERTKQKILQSQKR